MSHPPASGGPPLTPWDFVGLRVGPLPRNFSKSRFDSLAGVKLRKRPPDGKKDACRLYFASCCGAERVLRLPDEGHALRVCARLQSRHISQHDESTPITSSTPPKTSHSPSMFSKSA